MRYLIDVYTKADERIVNKLFQRPEDCSNQDEVSRYMWQISHVDSDVLVSDLKGFAIYHPTLEDRDIYTEDRENEDYHGIACIFDTGDQEEMVGKIRQFLMNSGTSMYAGWNIKRYIIPALYKAFIVNGFGTEVLDVFDKYPYNEEKTLDLQNIYNFNGQQKTVRARNVYHLEEVLFSYGGGGSHELALAYRENNIQRILFERIRMARFLYNKRGLEW